MAEFRVLRYSDGSCLVWRDGKWVGCAHDAFDLARLIHTLGGDR